MRFKIFRIIHLGLMGAITIPISIFMAAGAIGENFGDDYFVDPGFLVFILIWLVGAVLSFTKRGARFGLIISALPPMLFLGIITYTIISGFFI
ncbi:hypothetical protein LC048_20135 [Mesobacillus subterraneus]|uniref:hypothetical protein n=1 Tax=Mesobacillus subterraneus TaxID=285983 RepID=UPI001CFDB253|nr:hypothetical protein [Mesobacillus subterraneus]WLR54693.1 hypothetical protein LC048_20135 [Mesobacillus subterraneus]